MSCTQRASVSAVSSIQAADETRSAKEAVLGEPFLWSVPGGLELQSLAKSLSTLPLPCFRHSVHNCNTSVLALLSDVRKSLSLLMLGKWSVSKRCLSFRVVP